MSWQDRQKSKILEDESGQAYPFGQWINHGSDLEPRRESGGGLFFSDKSVDELGALPVGAESSRMHFSSGKSEDGVIVDSITVAPIISRMRYFSGTGRDKVYFPDYADGRRGNINLLCYIETEAGLRGPAVITLSGTTSKDLYKALKAHRARVSEATRGAAPASFFAITLSSGTPEKRGSTQKSLVTPLEFSEDFDVDRDYIGDDLADAIEEQWERFKGWQAEWGKQVEEDDEETPEEPRPQPQRQPERRETARPQSRTAPQRPAAPRNGNTDGNPLGAARERWSAAWNALKGIGVTAPMLNPAYKTAAQVIKAAEIMESIKDSSRDGDTPAQIREALDGLLKSV